MTFNPSDHPRESDGTFAEKTGAAPEFELATPPTDESILFRYQGDTFTEEGLRRELGLRPSDPREYLDEAIESMRAGGERDWSLPERFTEKRFELPGEDGYDLSDREVGWEPGGNQPTNPYVRLNDDGTILLTGDYYENMLWDERFTSEELDDAYPIVEKFFQERYGVELVDSGTEWDAIQLQFAATYKPEEFAPSFVASTSESRMNFIDFVNEHDPGTYGSPYAYDDLRQRLDEAVVVTDRWTALKAADGIDASAVAGSSRRTTEAPSDAEAIALARSLSGDEWSGAAQEEIESLAKKGFAVNSSGLRDGLESTRAATVFTDKQRRAEALLSWLESKDR